MRLPIVRETRFTMMVGDDDKREVVLKAISDEYGREILAATMLRGKTIEEIRKETSIPVSTCYRRIHKLLALKLLKIENMEITPDGKKFVFYRSVLGDVRVSLSQEQLVVEVSVPPEG